MSLPPSFSSSWRLRWRLRAVSALSGEDQLAGLACVFFAAHPLQLAIDAQASAGEIHVRPLEPKGLAHPEPGREG
jgi:hypothetical protein